MAVRTGSSMYRVTTLIVIASLVISTTYAACPSVQKMEVNQCKGYFFGEHTANKIKDDMSVADKKVDLLEKKIDLQDLQISKNEDIAAKWKAEAERQAEANSRNKNDFRNGVLLGAGGVVLSIVLTVLLVKSVR